MSTPGICGRVLVPAALAILAVALSGCTNDSNSLRMISVVPPADATIRFSADVQPIFTRSCAKSNCHLGTFAAQSLNLEAGKSYSNLVGVFSTEDSTLKRVDPGNSDLSYLIKKIEGTGLGARMPADGPPLPDAEIHLIRDWIDQGALDN